MLTVNNHYLTSTNRICIKCAKAKNRTPSARITQKAWREKNREWRLHYLKEYGKSESGKAAHKKFMLSEKGAALIQRWNSNEKCKEALRRYQRKYRVSEPNKVKARHLLKLAVFLGHITPSPACEICSMVPVEAHHWDYAQPLSVFWLCRGCHRKYGHGGSFRDPPLIPAQLIRPQNEL